MSNNQDGSTPSCAATCWGAGALVGVVLAGVLMFAAGWSFFGAVLIGVVAFGLVGGVMSYTLCRELPAIGAAKPAAAPKSSAAPAPEPAPAPAEPALRAEPAPAAPKEPAAAKAPESDAAEPKGTILPGEADLAARKGTWRYAPEADTAGAPAADAGAGAAGDVPHAIDAPRGGQADDLKLLRGIGPKLEQELNALGYYHFDQIAALTEAQSDALAERLTARGRANRANWIAHAREMVAEHGKAD